MTTNEAWGGGGEKARIAHPHGSSACERGHEALLIAHPRACEREGAEARYVISRSPRENNKRVCAGDGGHHRSHATGDVKLIKESSESEVLPLGSEIDVM